MKTRTRIPVRDLQRGTSFEMFKTECLTINATPNKVGWMVVRFVKCNDRKPAIRTLTVPPNFTFKPHIKT